MLTNCLTSSLFSASPLLNIPSIQRGAVGDLCQFMLGAQHQPRNQNPGRSKSMKPRRFPASPTYGYTCSTFPHTSLALAHRSTFDIRIACALLPAVVGTTASWPCDPTLCHGLVCVCDLATASAECGSPCLPLMWCMTPWGNPFTTSTQAWNSVGVPGFPPRGCEGCTSARAAWMRMVAASFYCPLLAILLCHTGSCIGAQGFLCLRFLYGGILLYEFASKRTLCYSCHLCSKVKCVSTASVDVSANLALN